MEPLLEWVVQRQLKKIGPHDAASADSGMHNPEALSKKLWGFSILALSGTTQAKKCLKVKRLIGLEAWRRIVVPLKPRSAAKRNALHTLLYNPLKSKNRRGGQLSRIEFPAVGRVDDVGKGRLYVGKW